MSIEERLVKRAGTWVRPYEGAAGKDKPPEASRCVVSGRLRGVTIFTNWRLPLETPVYLPSTASLNALAASSLTTVLALILMASPVWGLRPMRAAR